jgi:hypothetical protein
MHLTEHFTLEEFTTSEIASRRGIKNEPPKEAWIDIIRTCEGLEKIRALTEKPILIISGYRSIELNRILGSGDGSQHVLGRAADIICPRYGSAQVLAQFIESKKDDVCYDQLIYEFGSWVHVSFVADRPRKESLTIKSKRTGYRLGILT